MLELTSGHQRAVLPLTKIVEAAMEKFVYS